jgi:hypothetical protein
LRTALAGGVPFRKEKSNLTCARALVPRWTGSASTGAVGVGSGRVRAHSAWGCMFPLPRPIPQWLPFHPLPAPPTRTGSHRVHPVTGAEAVPPTIPALPSGRIGLPRYHPSTPAGPRGREAWKAAIPKLVAGTSEGHRRAWIAMSGNPGYPPTSASACNPPPVAPRRSARAPLKTGDPEPRSLPRQSGTATGEQAHHARPAASRCSPRGAARQSKRSKLGRTTGPGWATHGNVVRCGAWVPIEGEAGHVSCPASPPASGTLQPLVLQIVTRPLHRTCRPPTPPEWDSRSPSRRMRDGADGPTQTRK